MNGIHDMGGMQGFGPVTPEPNEPVFHSDWEARVLAMNRALGYARVWNIDMSRALVEKIPPHLYLTLPYYAKWFLRLEQLLIDRGLVGADEIAAGHALRPAKPLTRKLSAADVPKARTRGSFAGPPNLPARVKPGAGSPATRFHPQIRRRWPPQPPGPGAD